MTPSQKNGALIDAGFESLPGTIAGDGQRLIAPSLQCFAQPESCTATRVKEGTTYEFSRTRGGGWVTHALAPPASEFEGVSPIAYDPDAGTVLYSALRPRQQIDDFYGRLPGGVLNDVGQTTEGLPVEEINNVQATADFSHVVYEGVLPLWPALVEGAEGSNVSSLYALPGAGGGTPVLVGVSGGAGANNLIGVCGTTLAIRGTGNNGYNSMSADGRTIYFQVKPCEGGSGSNAGVEVPANELFARVDGSRTELVSGRDPVGCTGACQGSAVAGAKFEGASTDGSRVFFTSSQQLTDAASGESGELAPSGCVNAEVGVAGCNLYESECPDHCEGSAKRALVDVSAGALEPRVQGVLAVSPDGSHTYFVAQGVITTAPNAAGESAMDGEPNLYVYEHETAGGPSHVSFVTRLAGSDLEEWNESLRVANVTPDGQFLVFTSHRALTADDTRAEGPAQVYRYDAATRALVRISVGEDGYNDNGNSGIGDAAIRDASIPFGGEIGPKSANPTLSGDGAFVFFESPVGLTPDALDEVQTSSGQLAENIYEYHEGQVSLISDGRDVTPRSSFGNAVMLLGTDESGANVFFTTNDSLVSGDSDSQRDIYDAHLCSGGEPCLAAVSVPGPCMGEECHVPAVQSPVFGVPASVTFGGPGNLAAPAAAVVKPKVKTAAEVRTLKLSGALKACKRVKVGKRRSVCEKRARRAYGRGK